MKKLVNVYTYEKVYDEYDKENRKYITHNTCLSACHPKRNYSTKMKVEDLPEHYCDVKRYNCIHNVITSKGVVDVKYCWMKENHFMKDSVLYVSYTGKIEPYYDKFNYNGKEIVSKLVSYTNVDAHIFEHSIFKFLAYIHKYSKYDLTEIKKEFINHFEWLSENQPLFAPELGECKDYSELFDNIIKNEGLYDY